MHEAVKSFELEVRAVVRRGSKSNEFEDSIKEVVGHYADLFNEEIDKGASPPEAESLAIRRLGSPLNVGMQILNTLSRVERGIRIQKFALLTLLYSACHFVALEYFALRGWHGAALSIFGYSFFGIFLSASISFGLGVVLSNRILWKPLTAILLASIVLFGLTALSFLPMYVTYLNQPGMKIHKLDFEQPTLFTCLTYGLQLSERLIGSFVVFAGFSFLISRIWLMQKSWFRFSWR